MFIEMLMDILGGFMIAYQVAVSGLNGDTRMNWCKD